MAPNSDRVRGRAGRTVVALTDGLSNVTRRVNLTDAPVAAAVLRIQPTRGLFEPYNILREGEVLNHLAGMAVPVPGVLTSESDPRFLRGTLPPA